MVETYITYAPLGSFLLWMAQGWTLIGLAPGHHGEYSVIMERDE